MTKWLVAETSTPRDASDPSKDAPGTPRDPKSPHSDLPGPGDSRKHPTDPQDPKITLVTCLWHQTYGY